MSKTLPYKIATLCYLFDAAGRVLLLHRHKAPNRDLYSPIGGKLEVTLGESPTQCALREISEEAGLELASSDLHLTGIVSEQGYQDTTHWLMFLYEVKLPVTVSRTSFNEGTLEWFEPAKIEQLDLPQTDREVIWPLFWRYRGAFFMAHIRCDQDKLTWSLEQPPQDKKP